MFEKIKCFIGHFFIILEIITAVSFNGYGSGDGGGTWYEGNPQKMVHSISKLAVKIEQTRFQ